MSLFYPHATRRVSMISEAGNGEEDVEVCKGEFGEASVEVGEQDTATSSHECQK
jgi:hypothetical protein